MSGRQGAHKRDAMLARLGQYRGLRDAGNDTWDAATAIGMSDSTRKRYERWYRAQAGLPPLSPRPTGTYS